jgi:hypothetical protein
LDDSEGSEVGFFLGVTSKNENNTLHVDDHNLKLNS